jgi:phosphatidylglycerophosphate synthase
VCASILDGCDGEVARLKLQASAFGCWLETVCDYLYYLVIFAGMTIGLARSTGNGVYLIWGATLLFGAIATFVFASLGRQRLSGEHPEQYLAAWQAEAASRRSNPILRLGRYTEFLVRRCFLPYALLVFALLNVTNVALCLAAVGANVAWIISLCSYVTFPRRARARGVLSTSAVRQPEGYGARVP